MWIHVHPVEATGISPPSVSEVRCATFLLVSGLIALASCGGNADSQDTSSTLSPHERFSPSSLKWTACSDDAELRCADLDVPFDYSDPNIGTFTLKLKMHKAESSTKRVGYLLTNPGGPGFGGTYLVDSVFSFFSEELIDKFDIVGFDPRGTGSSTPAVDCVDSYDAYFAYDPSPDTDEEKQAVVDASQKFVDECQKKNSDILPYISTNNSARDMDAIRQALGVDTITYVGFSYGSELGATWATMFPATVRAAVFDGATDPNSDYVQGGLDQARGFENELTKFLKRCSSQPSCEFHNGGKSEEAFDALMEKLDSEPIVVNKKRAPVNQGIALIAVAQAMYSSSQWITLENALAEAQRGEGGSLLYMYDSYYQRRADGTYGNELEAFFAISCVDDPGPRSVKEVDAFIPDFMKAAPRLGSSFASGYVCTFWPTKTDKRIAITGKGAGPLVVVGTTGDAATPLQSSRNMASALEDGRFIVVTANQHTGYGANQCVMDAVDAYLISTEISWQEKLC